MRLCDTKYSSFFPVHTLVITVLSKLNYARKTENEGKLTRNIEYGNWVHVSIQ